MSSSQKITVKNIKIEEFKFGDLSAQLKKAYPFLSLSADDDKKIKELTPTHIRSIVYDLVGANTALANGARRVLLDEVEWPRLTCGMDDIKSDDPFCQRMTDYIQNRLWLIPTSYVRKTDKPFHITLDVKNSTTQPIIVKSRELQVKDAPKGFEFAKEVCITELLPGRFIKIQVTVEWGQNLSHASFSNFNGLIYRPLQHFGAGEKSSPDLLEKLVPSYSVHPTDYRLGFTCEQFVDPVESCLLAWQTIIDKLKTAHINIASFKEQKEALPYISDHLVVTQIKGNRIKYEFMNETYTLGNFLSWYAYQIDTSIAYILCGDDHPEDLSVVIKITHKDHASLLQQATVAAVKDIEMIMKQIK